MLKLIVVVLSVLLIAEQVRGDTSRAKAETALRKSLLKDYDRHVLPNEKTVMSFTGLSIINLKMHEADHSMDLHTWIKLSWNDPRLKWNSEEHKGIQMLSMGTDTVWTPDLTVYNSAEAVSDTVIESNIYALAFPDGKVMYLPPYKCHFTCLMDLTYWPHDTHNCSVKLGSWVRGGNDLDLIVEDFEIELEQEMMKSSDGRNIAGSEWIISKMNSVREVKYYSCCEEPYLDTKISLLLTRYAPAYAWTIKLPAVCLCLLTLVLFLLPPGAGEKVILGGVCLILDFLFINYTSHAVNNAPSHTPLIVQLIGQQIVLVLASVFLSAIVVRMARSPHTYGLPSFLKNSVVTLGRFLCLGNYANLKSSSHSNVKASEAEQGNGCSSDSHKQEIDNTSEWVLLAAVVDRLALLLYLAICIISLSRFSSIL